MRRAHWTPLRHCTYNSMRQSDSTQCLHRRETPRLQMGHISRSRPLSESLTQPSRTFSSMFQNQKTFNPKVSSSSQTCKVRPDQGLAVSLERRSGAHSRCIQRKSSTAFASSSSVPSRAEQTLHAQSQVQLDLGLEGRLSSENMGNLRENLSLRGCAFDLDQLLADYGLWRELDGRKSGLERERADIAKTMAALVKNQMSEDILLQKQKLTERGKAVKEQLKDIMSSWWIAEQKVRKQALHLPADLHPRTPHSEDQVIQVYKDPAEDTDTGEVSHEQLAERLGLLKFSNVGPRAVYMLGEAAELELSLLHAAAACARGRGYLPVASPEMFRSLVVEGCGKRPEESAGEGRGEGGGHQSEPFGGKFSHVFHSLQAKGEEREEETKANHLVGSSLMSFAAFLTQVQVKKGHLPLRMYSSGRHYRPQSDAGLPGLYGLVQSNRVTLFGAGQGREETSEMHDTMATLTWEMVQKLGLPARKVLVSGPNLSSAECLRTEVHIWAPSLKRYAPMAFVSIHDDYVSRRLMSKASNGQQLHMVSGVVMDTAVVLASMLEGFCRQGGTRPLLSVPDLTGGSNGGDK
ncbi:hypothetical protein ACOMHN_044693 [Nucella lapillus]